MANNQHVNKVEFGNRVLMDISDTTANASDVLYGKKFYTASGAPMTGVLNLGSIVYGANNSATVSVEANAGVEINSITLTKGIWIVVSCADWASNGDGYRQISIGADSLNPTRNYAATTNAVTGKETYQQCIRIVGNSSGEVQLKSYARHGASGNINVYPYMYAVLVGVV